MERPNEILMGMQQGKLGLISEMKDDELFLGSLSYRNPSLRKRVWCTVAGRSSGTTGSVYAP
jgi:hypothetical protein